MKNTVYTNSVGLQKAKFPTLAAVALAVFLSACGGTDENIGQSQNAASTVVAPIPITCLQGVPSYDPTQQEENPDMKKTIGVVLTSLAISSCAAQQQAPFLPSVFANFDLSAGPTVKFDDTGIPSVIIWSTGQFNQSPTTIAQWGLGAYARSDMAKVIKASDWLLAHQDNAGGFPLTFDHTNSPNDSTHGYHLKAGWRSAITQGNAISLLSRVYLVTNDSKYRDAALLALKPLQTPVTDGGVQGALNGMPWFEETPDPNYPNHIFNGSVFALLGIHDLYRITGSYDALQLWKMGEASLRANLNTYVSWAPLQGASFPDPWMLYDLQVNGFPATPNYVQDFYMGIHIKLMREMYARTGALVYSETADAMEKSLNAYLKATSAN